MRVLPALSVLTLLLGSSTSLARPTYPGAIPNGNANSCATCHVNPAGGGARNTFGLDVESNMPFSGPDDSTWAKIFCADSDGDGKTNGQELGDPCGAWRGGDDDPAGVLTNPSDEADTTADVGDCEGEAPPTCELAASATGCPCSSGSTPDLALSAAALAILVFRRPLIKPRSPSCSA